MLGDGGINNDWQANITLNSKADATYSKYVATLCYRIFGIHPAIRKRKERKTLVVSLSSTAVVDFLVGNGLPRGNKLKHGLEIPEWILCQRIYRRQCVRGLMDTDGCLYVHRHNVLNREYRNIGLCFTSHSLKLIGQVAAVLEEFRITPHITDEGRRIYLYSGEAVTKYMRTFGTSNDRIGSVYKEWRDG